MIGEMTPKEIMLYALGEVSELEWSNYRMNCYSNWCLHWSIENSLPLRPMILSKTLFNWYCQNWNEMEETFYKDFKDYLFGKSVYCKNEFDCLSQSYRKTISLWVEYFKENCNCPDWIIDMIKRGYKSEIYRL